MSAVSHFVMEPKGVLRRYVREILWVHSQAPRVQMLLPETALTMALRLSGSASLQRAVLPGAVVSGHQETTRLVEHAANSSLLIVRFTEVGASAILHDRADLLYNRMEALDGVLPHRDAEDLQGLLAETVGLREQIRVVERFLLGRLRTEDRVPVPIERAARMLLESQGTTSIVALARAVGMSQSALERHFRATVGTTPKMLARLARLQGMCRLWDAGKSLTEIAADAGYSDQSHMVRDFRSFTGIAPKKFFQSGYSRNLPTFYK